MNEVYFCFNWPSTLEGLMAILNYHYEHKASVSILCRDQTHQEELNILLWTQAQYFFLPHVLRTSPLVDRTPIVLDSWPKTTYIRQICINLSGQVFDTPYDTHILEIVTCVASDRNEARKRFRQWQDKQYMVYTIDAGLFESQYVISQ